MASAMSNKEPIVGARVAGFGLLGMTILALFTEAYIRPRLIVPHDATETTMNILLDHFLFRLLILCYLSIAVLDLIVAWGLYLWLRPTNEGLSLLMAWLRVVYAAILACSLGSYLEVIQIIEGVDEAMLFESTQWQSQILFSLNAFNDGWGLGLIVFALHLVVLGVVIVRSGYLPKWLGLLVAISSLGYFTDSIGRTISADYALQLASFTFWGELLLMFWLIFMRVDMDRERSV